MSAVGRPTIASLCHYVKKFSKWLKMCNMKYHAKYKLQPVIVNLMFISHAH